MDFNPRTCSYILYCRLQDTRCVRLIEKFQIPRRGARIGVQDLDLLILDTPGGKDQLLLENPWMRIGYPALVNMRTSDKYFGFKDVDHELMQYHHYLDTYHASVQEMKLPVHANVYGPRRVPPPPSRPPPPQAILPPVKEDKKKNADVEIDIPPAQGNDELIDIGPATNYIVQGKPGEPQMPSAADVVVT